MTDIDSLPVIFSLPAINDTKNKTTEQKNVQYHFGVIHSFTKSGTAGNRLPAHSNVKITVNNMFFIVTTIPVLFSRWRRGWHEAQVRVSRYFNFYISFKNFREYGISSIFLALSSWGTPFESVSS